MWTIYEEKKLLKILNKLPLHIKKKYEIWKTVVMFDGQAGLRRVKGFHDESLKGDWKGYRSSRLSLEWRIIYKIEDTVCEVFVVDVNHHRY